MKQRISKVDNRFLDAYFGEAGRNAAQAGRIVGLSTPEKAGPRVANRLRKVIESRELELSEKAKLSSAQVVEELCKVALDTDNPAQRVRALEVLAKIHGMTDSKVNVTVDRKLVSADLDSALAKLMALELSREDSTLEPKLLTTSELTNPS